MTCGKCPYTDGLVYTSLPPKVKCIITGEFHDYGDCCTCENARKVKENMDRFEAKVRELPPDTEYVTLNDVVNPFVTGSTGTLMDIDISAVMTGTPCLVCRETIDTGFHHGPMICDACKKAILHVRESLEKTERRETIYD